MSEVKVNLIYVGTELNKDLLNIFEAQFNLYIFPNTDKLLKYELDFYPRAFIWDISNIEISAVTKIILEIRKKWSLLDIILKSENMPTTSAVDFMKIGVAEIVLTKEVDLFLNQVNSVIKQQKILPKISKYQRGRNEKNQYGSLLSRSPKMWDIFEQAEKVAQSEANILILGETGTGKELLARAIHKTSKVSGKFVPVNCAAIPEHLIDSELFGYLKGAFTGAVSDKKGLFSQAEKGTILLDEIGNMPMQGQHHLLRVLQESAIRPVGGVEEIPINVRVIAATSRELEQAVNQGTFKVDLFYRLDVVRFVIPPLRERPEDIIYLFGLFASKISKFYKLNFPKISDCLLAALSCYPWPGNVRQLENITERLILSHPNQEITAEIFEKVIQPQMTRTKNFVLHQKEYPKLLEKIQYHLPFKEAVKPAIKDIEREYFTKLLKQNNGKMGETAKAADIDRKTLLRKIKQLEIQSEEYKNI